MRWIFLSPHFDDAVLSCGGIIWQQAHAGITVEVWTVFAAQPDREVDSDYARHLHSLWQTASGREAVERRTVENARACARLGAAVGNLEFLDALYRPREDGGVNNRKEVMNGVCRLDEELVGAIERRLLKSLAPGDLLIIPLALGGHIDHRTTNAAARRLTVEKLYYADVPYVIEEPQDLAGAVRGMAEHRLSVSEQGLACWVNAIECYESQLSMLFGAGASVNEVMQNYFAGESSLSLWAEDASER